MGGGVMMGFDFESLECNSASSPGLEHRDRVLGLQVCIMHDREHSNPSIIRDFVRCEHWVQWFVQVEQGRNTLEESLRDELWS